jgi:hypothetical protein
VSRMTEEQAAAILDTGRSPVARARTSTRAPTQLPIDDDVASGDDVADELWAREIIAATGARR